MPGMLRALAETGRCFPGAEPFDTPEKWYVWLNKIADQLERASEGHDSQDSNNEYYEEWQKICSSKIENNIELTIQEKIVKKKYFDRMVEIEQAKKKLFKETMMELIEYWDYLWD